jgi:Ni,Fe-hydrogenase III component G
MTDDARRSRTLRLLEGRLEALALVEERSLSGSRRVEHCVLGVEAATRHAVELHVLSEADARRIWADVARRHPAVPWCQRGCPGIAA